MGDVGSLALGAALGTVAILIKQELLLVIVGGVFVLEALSVVIQVASFKLTGQRVFKMAPLHHHFELIGWSEPKVISRFVIVAIIFALFSLDDAEAEMRRDCGIREFGIRAPEGIRRRGQRVTVVGAARSGIAAAELLAGRGARVTLTDVRAEVPEANRCARWASRSSWAGTGGGVRVRRPRRAEPRRAARAAARRRGAAARGAGRRRARAGVALAARPRHRHHRHEGEVDDHRAHGADARGRRVPRRGRRQHRQPAQRAGVRVDARHAARRRGEQLPARADRDVPSVDRRDAELLARPPRPASGASRRTRRRRRGSSRTRSRTTGRSSTPTIPPCSSSRAARGPGAALRPARGRSTEGDGRRGRVDRRSRRTSATARLVPLDAVQLLGPHLVDDVMAAATVGAIAGAAPHGDDGRGRRVPRPRARDGGRGDGGRRAVRERLEGDQRRVGAAIDRELRSRTGRRSSAAASRAATSRLLRAPLAARAKAVVAIGESRGRRSRGARRVPCRCTKPESLGRGGADGVRAWRSRGRGAARARLFELRHVPRLRGARPGVQGRGARDSA